MSILITGGGGFIGRNLAKLLPGFGHTVFAPSHSELDVLHKYYLEQWVEENEIKYIIHTATSGGTKDIDYEHFEKNLRMCQNLIEISREKKVKIFNIGSGAEFDRASLIRRAEPKLLWERWPKDLYGLSKNITAKRFLKECDFRMAYSFRLFGCFGEDEDHRRFIRRCIERMKAGRDVEIARTNGTSPPMDFFYVGDLALVINAYIRSCDNGIMVADPNLVYPEKFTLDEIADIIYDEMPMGFKPYYPKKTEISPPFKNEYTGTSESLEMLGISLVGLKGGIRNMIKALV